MKSKKTGIVGVTQYYCVPISEGYDPYDIDNPIIQDKIPDGEKTRLTEPEYYYYPIHQARQVEIIRVGRTPIDEIREYSCGTEQRFNKWVRIAIEKGLTSKEKLNDWLETQIEQTLKPKLDIGAVIPVSDDEIIFLNSNITSIAIDEENKLGIVLTLTNTYSYILEEESAQKVLHRFTRDTFNGATNLLALYDYEF